MLKYIVYLFILICCRKASQKSVELVESMRREVETKSKLNETNSKIKEMSAKLETYTRSMEGLTEHVKRLQNENKVWIIWFC